MIRVMVVDDSAFIRKAIKIILQKDPEIRVVSQAANGEEALEFLGHTDVDVITMDVDMPRLDGISAVREIMTRNPKPVLMISALTTNGAETTLRALEAGAMDFVAKPSPNGSLDIHSMEESIRSKVKAVAKRPSLLAMKAARHAPPPNAAPYAHQALKYGLTVRNSTVKPVLGTAVSPYVVEKPAGRHIRDIVAIGVSTGGPPAVQKVLTALPRDFPVPILIAQHMPASFTAPFARRLNTVCEIEVKEAVSGEKLQTGVAYIAPGGRHIRLEYRLSSMVVVVSDHPESALYKPSADVLHTSVAKTLGKRAVGIQLTGMGSDGLEGIRILKQQGGRALAQSDATCVVYGMPKVIVDAGLADEIVDLDDMALAIMCSLYK